jgi:sucrose-phosphate synthase
VATGRALRPTLEVLDELGVRPPDVLVTACGTEIRYGRRLVRDRSWERQIRHRWEPHRVREVLDAIPGLRHLDEHRTEYRLRYALDGSDSPSIRRIRTRLRKAGIRVTVLPDRVHLFDVVPVRASPGLALRFFGFKWNLEPGRILVAGDSGNDRDMLEGETLGVVVANHTPELEPLRDSPRVYFAEQPYAWGIREGIEHYDFFGTIDPGDQHRHDH